MAQDFAAATEAARYGQTRDARCGGRDPGAGRTCAGIGAGGAALERHHRGDQSGDYKRRRDPTCPPFEPVPCNLFVSEATFGLPVFRFPDAADEVAKLLKSVALFPERTHLVGAYALGKAQRIIRLLREAGYDKTLYMHGAMASMNALYQAHGVDLGPLAPATDAGAQRPARRDRDRAAFGHRRQMGAALCRSHSRFRQRLDDGAGPRPPAPCRTAAGGVATMPTGTS